jgi:multidrug efflux pump subunit AcrA (membrane-fusion protein)
VHGQEQSTIGIFKVDPDGAGAVRVQVKLGRGSVTWFEIIEGLKEGDVVILSDTTQWDASDRIRIS